MENNTNETTKINAEQLSQVKGGRKVYPKVEIDILSAHDTKHEKWIDVLSVGFRR